MLIALKILLFVLVVAFGLATLGTPEKYEKINFTIITCLSIIALTYTITT